MALDPGPAHAIVPPMMRGVVQSMLGVCFLANSVFAAESAAQAKPAEAPAVAAEKDTKVPEPAAVISKLIKGLAEPTLHEFPQGWSPAISTSSEEAQEHVRQGINYIHAGWDFEAYRHFCAAVQKDPDCLMAYWGIGLALAQPNPELLAEREAAVLRMMALCEGKVGTDLERSHCVCLAIYYRDGVKAAAEAYKKLSEKFPNDPQALLLYTLFSRGGYDEFGDPTPDQERSERLLKEKIAAQPDQPLWLNAYLMVHAEARDVREALPMARKLVEMDPEFPPYQHVLGHYAWRSGEHREAEAAFGRSAIQYQAAMAAQKLSVVDCPGWVRAQCYRAVAMASRGDVEGALAVAKSLSTRDIPESRVHAPGATLLLWEGRTLAARLLMRRDGAGDPALAIAALPKTNSAGLFRKDSLSLYLYQGLAIACEARKALAEGNRTRALQVTSALELHGTQMTKMRAQAAKTAELSQWIRANQGMQIISAELRGRIALAGDKTDKLGAYGWFRSGEERQTPSSMMMPPLVMTPLAGRVADAQTATGTPEQALEAIQEALKQWPNDILLLEQLESLLETQGKKEEAAKVEQTIKGL